MVKSEIKVRVRYGETDKMGYCYYGVYAQYYEVGRTELIRMLGLSYKELEDQGIMLPVLSLNINYNKPAYYDDELTVKTTLSNMPSVKIDFKYEVYNQHNELLNIGETTLVFVNAESRKPIKAPLSFRKELASYFN